MVVHFSAASISREEKLRRRLKDLLEIEKNDGGSNAIYEAGQM